MNFKEITFVNEYIEQSQIAPTGFSWTTLFFGCFPAIFRGDWKWASLQFVLAFLTHGLSWLVMPFIYNKLYIRGLLKKGFIPTDENQCKYLVSKGIIGIQEIKNLIDASKYMCS